MNDKDSVTLMTYGHDANPLGWTGIQFSFTDEVVVITVGAFNVFILRDDFDMLARTKGRS